MLRMLEADWLNRIGVKQILLVKLNGQSVWKCIITSYPVKQSLFFFKATMYIFGQY